MPLVPSIMKTRAEWFRISEGSEMWYRMYTLEMNNFAVRVKTKQSCVGYTLKSVMCSTWVSMSCMQSTPMASWLERRGSWFHNIKSDYSSKKVVTGIWKGTDIIELSV